MRVRHYFFSSSGGSENLRVGGSIPPLPTSYKLLVDNGEDVYYVESVVRRWL